MLRAKDFIRMFAVAVLVMGMSVAPISGVYADDDEDEGDDEGQQVVVSNALWKTECGACHAAYPPRMLPAESWHAVMSGLDKHFGSNAGLDAASAKEITAFLEENASTKGREASGKPLLRITETREFKSEHDEVAARDWKNPKVKSPANCGACHTQAESGDFSEHNVKIPR